MSRMYSYSHDPNSSCTSAHCGICNQAQFFRLVDIRRIGNIVGSLKELLEAAIPSESQCKALKAKMADEVYDWFNDIGEKLTEGECVEALKKHWAKEGLPPGAQEPKAPEIKGKLYPHDTLV